MEVIRKPDKCINAFCTSVCSGADVETMEIIFGGNPKNCPRYKYGRDEYLTEHDKQIRADAIEDCIKTMQKMFEYTDRQGLPHYALCAWINLTSIRDTLEQLKEQQNE